MFETNLSVQELCNIGVLLGADVPFCIVGGTCLAEGIGEQLTELKAMPDCYILIAKKGVKSSTKDMYKKLDAKPFSIKSDYDSIISNLEKGDLKRVCQYLSNSFESVCKLPRQKCMNVMHCIADFLEQDRQCLAYFQLSRIVKMQKDCC